MANEIQKLPPVNETIPSAFNQFQNVQPLVYDNSISPYETISKLLWYVKLLISTTNSIIDNMGEFDTDFDEIRNDINAIKTRIGQLETELGSVKNRLDGHDTDITNINNEINEIHNNLNDIANDINDISNSISAIHSRLDNHDVEISSIKSNIETINSTLNNLQEQITSNDADISQINSAIETINGNINTINSTIDNLQSQITSNDTDIAALQGDVSSLSGDLSKLQSDVTAMQTSLEEQITNNSNDISVLQGRMTSAEGNVSKLQLDVSSLENRFTLMGNTIEIIQNNINTINNNINSINDAINSINSNISTLQTSVENNRQDISNLKNRADTTDTTLSQIQNDISNLNIDTIREQLLEINTNISDLEQATTTLSNKVSSNGIDIEALKKQATSIENALTTLDNRIDGIDSEIDSIRTVSQQNASNITQLQNDVKSAKDSVASLSTRMQAVETEISSLDARMESAEDSVTELEDAVKNVMIERSVRLSPQGYYNWFSVDVSASGLNSVRKSLKILFTLTATSINKETATLVIVFNANAGNIVWENCTVTPDVAYSFLYNNLKYRFVDNFVEVWLKNEWQNTYANVKMVVLENLNIFGSPISFNEVAYSSLPSDISLTDIKAGNNILSITSSGIPLTVNKAIVAAGNNSIKTVDVSDVELSYLTGASDNIQEQINFNSLFPSAVIGDPGANESHATTQPNVWRSALIHPPNCLQCYHLGLIYRTPSSPELIGFVFIMTRHATSGAYSCFPYFYLNDTYTKKHVMIYETDADFISSNGYIPFVIYNVDNELQNMFFVIMGSRNNDGTVNSFGGNFISPKTAGIIIKNWN